MWFLPLQAQKRTTKVVHFCVVGVKDAELAADGRGFKQTRNFGEQDFELKQGNARSQYADIDKGGNAVLAKGLPSKTVNAPKSRTPPIQARQMFRTFASERKSALPTAENPLLISRAVKAFGKRLTEKACCDEVRLRVWVWQRA